MPVLGVGGQLVLRREAPDPCVLPNSGIDPGSDTFESICPGYWSGDHVSVENFPGIIDGIPPGDPDFWGSYYGSRWFLGPNRDHVTNDSHRFYKTDSEEYLDGMAGDAAYFYGQPYVRKPEDPPERRDYFIFIDELGRVSFYTTRCKALAGCKKDRIELANVAGITVIAPFGSLDYQNAVESCYSAVLQEFGYSDIVDAVTLESICDFAPDYQQPEANPNTEEFAYDNANVTPRDERQEAPYWECVAELREYTLNLTAAEIDTSAVSEKFGTAVKSMVNGGGSMEFFIDRKCFKDGVTNGMTLMKLLLMTEKGCKADAKFYMIQREGACGVINEKCGQGLITGDLYYRADILITQTAVNLRPTELVVGTAEFVTTGDIRLLESN